MKLKKRLSPLGRISMLVFTVCLFVTVALTFLLYFQTKRLFEHAVRDHIVSIVRNSALKFDTETLDTLRSHADTKTKEYRNVVFMLQKIKETNKNIRFAYIQRKTDDPTILEFVADADAISPDRPLDYNNNGVVDENEILSLPGDAYDVSDYPDFITIAFSQTYVDEKLSVDQWGTHLSATHPISSEYLIGIDFDVSDYARETTVALWEFLVFILFVLIILLILTALLLKIWGSRVDTLQDLDRQKDELLSLVSHQLAKPITAIKWGLESLLDGDSGNLNASQKEAVNSTQAMATTMADLVGMILDVSRIQLGKIHLDPQPLDLGTLITELMAMGTVLAEHRKIALSCTLSPTKLPVVSLDRRYMRMVLENLLTNAIKYTPEGGTVHFRLQVADGWMRCQVQDTGCGIPQKEQAKIFGKMYRASNVRNTIEGNGFGLYIAKGAVEAQGGTLRFESDEGKGTTFFVDVPI